MKKIIAVLLILTMALSLSGCGKKDVQYANEPEGTVALPGAWDGEFYKNEFAKLQFKLPENFTAATEKEMEDLNAVSEGTYIYDMMCQNEETGSNIIVMYENVLDSFGRATVTSEEYLDVAEEQMEQSGFTIEGRYKKTLCGEEYDALEISVVMDEVGATQYSFVRREGNYIVSVIIAVIGNDSFDSIIKNFI